MTEYRRDSSTDTLFKKDREGQWVPIEGEAQPVASMQVSRSVEQPELQPLANADVNLDVAAIQQANTLGASYEDRAKGFRIKVNILAVVMSLFGVILGCIIYGVPTLNNLTIAWLGTIIGWAVTSFALTWLIAFMINELNSPDTVTLIGIFGALNELRQHRLEQNRRYWDERD